jgi:hypothetical protein
MAVNIKKTKFIIFHSKGKRCDLEGKRLVIHKLYINVISSTSHKCQYFMLSL